MKKFKQYEIPATTAVASKKALIYDFDCLVDLRSIEYEHWTYNYGMINQVMASRFTNFTRIRVTKALSQLLNQNDIRAGSRFEWPSAYGGRFLSLLMRELLSVIELFCAVVLSKRILILNAHPICLFLASPILAVCGKKVTLCLHNDLIIALREDSFELRIERWLWWWISRSSKNITYLAPNKYYAQFIRKFFPSRASVVILPHPTIPRALYEQVALKDHKGLFPRAFVGFFGRVEKDRGIAAFESHIKQHSEKVYIVAGRGASEFPTYSNVYCYERPPTDIYCALVTRSEYVFLDLRGDSYRIGESGVFWDAVGLDAGVMYGDLPLMYRKRMQQYFGRRSVKIHP